MHVYSDRASYHVVFAEKEPSRLAVISSYQDLKGQSNAIDGAQIVAFVQVRDVPRTYREYPNPKLRFVDNSLWCVLGCMNRFTEQLWRVRSQLYNHSRESLSFTSPFAFRFPIIQSTSVRTAAASSFLSLINVWYYQIDKNRMIKYDDRKIRKTLRWKNQSQNKICPKNF